jgi:4a-hydroxytetrahydrobiopterin dehydratase
MSENPNEKLAFPAVHDTLPRWSILPGGLHATFDTGSFVTGTDFVRRIADLAEAANHHPDIDLRYGRVRVRTISHDVGGITRRDIELATRIEAVADELGAPITRAGVGAVTEIAIDALDIPAVRPFWQAVMGYAEAGDRDLVDAAGIGPLIWFQQMDEPRPQRNRIHFDVWVDAADAEQRLADTLAAGGRLVSDEGAPSFWVLADPEGNEACICTWQQRSKT